MAITVVRDGDVLVATMDDGKANALGFEAVVELEAAVAAATEQACPLVLAGREGVFCAGFDLAIMRSGDYGQVLAILTDGARLYRAIVDAPVPVVAACTGHALAGGALLLLAADHRIGARGPCKIGLNEVQIGMGLPTFAIAMARHRLVPRYLTAATCFAEVAEAERAVELGYLDELADEPVAAAVALAGRLAALPSAAFSVTKARLRAELSADLERLLPGPDEVLPTP